MAIGRAIKVNEKDIKAYRLVNRNKAARANAMGVTAIMGVSNGRGARSKFLRRTTVTKIKPPKSGRRVVGGIELYSSPPKKHREAGAVKRAHYALPQGYRYPIHGRSQKISEKYVKRAMSYYGKSREAYSPVVRREIEFGIARGARALGLTSPKAAVYRKKFKLNPRARGEDMLFLKRNPKRKAPKASIGGKHVTLKVVKGAVRATVPNKKKAAKKTAKRKPTWTGPVVHTVVKKTRTAKRRGLSISKAKKVEAVRTGKTIDLLVTNRRRKGYRRNPESYFEMMESGALDMPETISEREKAKISKAHKGYRSERLRSAVTKRMKARRGAKPGLRAKRAPVSAAAIEAKRAAAKAEIKAEAKAKRVATLAKARAAKKAKHEKEVAKALKQLRQTKAQATKKASKVEETKKMKKRAKKTVSKSKKASKSGTQKKARKTRKTLSKKAFLARMAAGRKRAAAKRSGKATKKTRKVARKAAKKTRKVARKPAKKTRKVAKKSRKPARKAARRVKRNARMFRRNPMLATVQSYIKPGLFALGGFVAHSVLTSLVADFASSRLGLKAGSRSLSAAATALAGGWVAAKYAKANAQEIIVGMAVSLARTVIAEFAPTVAPKLGLSGTRMVGTAADFAPRYSVGEYYQATGALPMEAAAGTGEYFSSNMFPVSGAGEYFLPSMSVQGYGDYEVQPGFSSSTAGIGVAEGVLPTDDMDATFNMMEAAAGIGAYAGGPSPAPVSTYIPHERALTVGNKAEDTTAGIFDIGGSNGVLS